MRAVQFLGNKQFRISEVEMPQISSDELLLKVKYTGICGSDIHVYQGHMAKRNYPLIMGHEFSGEVIEAGKDAAGMFQAGDRVTVNPLVYCGKCHNCRSGIRHLCTERTFTGYTSDGGFAEYVKISAHQAYKLPEHVPLDVAAMTEPYAVGVHAINISGLNLGDNVIILGGGTIGLVIALAARSAGAGQIAISEVSEYRLEAIRRLGFTAIDSKTTNVKEAVMEMTDGIGADVAFDAAGAPVTAEQVTQVLRFRGTAVIAGLYAHPPKVDLNDLNFRELVLKGTTVYSDRDFKHAIQSMPVESLQKMISHRLPLEEVQNGFETASAAEAMKVLIAP
jgi:2-desacetyl-2-hydroxyethyl bacteriochlorophyllide A dehydrogenase